MKLDKDLQAINDKIEVMAGPSDRLQFNDEERRAAREALQRLQQARAEETQTQNASAEAGSWWRELEFLAVCVGFSLVAYAVIVALRGSGPEGMGGMVVFALSYLAGASGALIAEHYWRPWIGSRSKAVYIGAVLLLIGSAGGLLTAGAIGGALGVVLGVAFFYAVVRNARQRRQQQTSAATG